MASPSEVRSTEVREWTLTVYAEMVAAGYVTPPWQPTDGMVEKLEGYFTAGMTPAEAAAAAFAVYH